jgi:hypothetical protein
MVQLLLQNGLLHKNIQNINNINNEHQDLYHGGLQREWIKYIYLTFNHTGLFLCS